MAKIEGGATQYYHADHLSVRAMTDSNGSKIGEQGHYPFGESWYSANTTTKWEFTSYERDSESGNDYAMARYHVNRLGRFSSPDALSRLPGDPQSLNRYAYVENDPINAVDPLGLDKVCEWKCWNLPHQPDEPPLIHCDWVCQDVPDPTEVGILDSLPHLMVGVGVWDDMHLRIFWQRTKTVNQCAAKNASSLASVFHFNQNNFWVRTFLGNDASALSNLAFGPGRMDAAKGLAVSNPTKYGLINLGAKAAGQIPTGGQIYVASAVVQTPYGEAINMTPVGKTIGSVAGKAVGSAAEIVTGFKAVFDVGAYIYAEVGCAVK